MSDVRSIKIAVTALGGQGGGVLASWIGKLGEENGYIAQTTSVPGVAQRTGATVYYIELFPQSAAQIAAKEPVLALMPVPGDVDIVIAAELMEAGRAMMRGFVTAQTTLIASSHRDYAISEKSGMGDERQSTDNINDVCRKSANAFIIADMAAAAAKAGAAISAVLFGVLAGSGALPIERRRFEDQIKKMGRSVESNMRGFALGWEISAGSAVTEIHATGVANAQASAPQSVAALMDKFENEFPSVTRFYISEGLKRVADYQDVRYAKIYLDQLSAVHAIDRSHGGERREWRLTQLAVKHLALWMTYEDSIRVADLKTRASRFVRFREDVKAEKDQIVNVYEFLHPRVEEICDILPSTIARLILKSRALQTFIKLFLGEGKRIPTTKVRGFLPLYFLSSLRFMRRASYRFQQEQGRIADWLLTIEKAVETDYAFAVELVQLQRLIKGYGDTHERGLGNYQKIMAVTEEIQAMPNPASELKQLRNAALADEDGIAFRAAIDRITSQRKAAA